MKNNIRHTVTMIVFTIVAISTFAQAPVVSLQPFAEFPLGTGANEFVYSDSLHVGNSPSDPTIFHGDRLWISELENGTLIDLKSRKICGEIAYPNDYMGAARIWNSAHNLFTKTKLYTNPGDIFSYRIEDNPPVLVSDKSYDQPANEGYPFLIRDYVFFYTIEGSVCTIDSEGVLLQQSATQQLLLDWLDKTWYASEEVKDAHRELIKTGQYLIVDGMYYPTRSARQLLSFYKKSGIAIDTELEAKLNGTGERFSTFPDGVALNGDMYICFPDGVNVISQTGKILAVIDDDSINPRIVNPLYNSGDARDNVSRLYRVVHPNGDVYTLYAIKDEKAHIHRAEKNWGTDLIALARAGVRAESEVQVRGIVRGLNNVELRILKNALFALHGYAFKSYDLSCYFRGYSWYTADESVKNDTSLFTPGQRQLLTIISGIERERTVR